MLERPCDSPAGSIAIIDALALIALSWHECAVFDQSGFEIFNKRLASADSISTVKKCCDEFVCEQLERLGVEKDGTTFAGLEAIKQIKRKLGM